MSYLTSLVDTSAMTATDAPVYEVVCTDIRALTRPEWLELRRLGLGSSDAAPSTGLSPDRSQYSLWCDKRGLIPEFPDNERMWWGREVEPLIIRRWQRDHDGEVQRHLMLRSIEYPWMLADLDGLTGDRVLEAKQRDGFDFPRWQIGVPDHISLQVTHQMIVSGRRLSTVCVLFGGNHYEEYEIPFDGELAAQLIGAEREMWRRVQEDDAPDPDHSESTTQAIRDRWYESTDGKVVELPAEAFTWLAMRATAIEAMKPHADAVATVKNLVRDALEDAEAGLINDQIVCTCTPNKNGTRVLRFKDGN